MVHKAIAGIVHWKLRCSLSAVVISLLCFVYILLHHNFIPVFLNHKVDKVRIEKKNEIIPVPGCNCSRKNYYHVDSQTQRNRLLSSCSDPGTFYQPSQKVASYSLYLPECIPPNKCQDLKSFYLQGIHENLRTMRLYYPTYTMRVYTDVTRDPQFCSIICNNSDLFWCDVRASPMNPNRNLSQVFFMIWRFLPLGDPTVDHFLSRDLDSILSEREAAVVADWLSLPKKKAIHVMRDKRHSHDVPMLGGMWGASNSFFEGSGNQSAVSIMASMLNVCKDTIHRAKGFDQSMLSSMIFHPLKDKIVAYDSYHCEYWKKYTMVRPFPMKRKNKNTDFVGNPGLGRANYTLGMCPVECRPEHGKDWESC